MWLLFIVGEYIIKKRNDAWFSFKISAASNLLQPDIPSEEMNQRVFQNGRINVRPTNFLPLN